MARIYDRLDLDQRRGLPALYVIGTLPDAKAGMAYEGRLQICNAVGACTVEQIDGDVLPPGHALYVDQDANEVVIAWPEYAEASAPIQNPGFEDGLSGWAAGAGWSVTTNNAITGSRSAVYQRNGGSSVISSQSRYPVNPGVPISAECWVRQGASSAGNAGAGMRLEFRDAAGDVIDRADGNYVMSASKNAVYPSNVTALPPAGAVTVNVAGVGVRHRENKDVWIDSFSWNHYVAAAGINIETTLHMTLRVRDSAGRSALWSGEIDITDGWDPGMISPFVWLDESTATSNPSYPGQSYWGNRGVGSVHFRSESGPTVVDGGLASMRIRDFSGSQLLHDEETGNFAAVRDAVWYAAVVKRTGGTGNSCIIGCSIGAASSFASHRASLFAGRSTAGNSWRPSVGGRRLDTDSFFEAQHPADVVGWEILVGVINYQARTVSLSVNGGVRQITSNAWTASGMSQDAYGRGLTVGAVRLGDFVDRMTGQIAEVIADNSAALTIEDEQKLVGYLAHKWGLAGLLPASHPYKSAPPT